MTKDHSSGFLNLVSDTTHDVSQIEVDHAKSLIDTKETILVDVRETEEWDDGYIPNAIHLSKGVIERDIEKVIPNKESELILYCRGGYRSLLAAHNIKQMGYKNVHSMTGGITAWISAGYPIAED